MNNTFKGTGVAIVTPFTQEGEVDYPALEKLLNHIIDGGVDFIVALGTTSEAATLTSSEKEKVMDSVKSVVDGRKPIVIGIGGNDTRAVVQTIQQTNFVGIEGILSVAPYYNKPNQRGLYAHFEQIAGVSPLPLIIYNVPGRTSSNISAETCIRLATDFPNIVGVKEASGDLTQIMSIVRQKPADFLVLSGDDALTLPMIALGADGVISVVANAFPGEFSTMVRQALSGNFRDARNIHYQLLPIIDALFADGNPAGVKAALQIRGIVENELRLPLVKASEQVIAALNSLIAKLY